MCFERKSDEGGGAIFISFHNIQSKCACKYSKQIKSIWISHEILFYGMHFGFGLS